VNDGACVLVIASEQAAKRFALTPRARIVITATAGVEPRIMGMGPVPASRKALSRAGLSVGNLDVMELNEAFAAAGVSRMRPQQLDDRTDSCF
jgi:acetyl-CoA acetyltransferase